MCFELDVERSLLFVSCVVKWVYCVKHLIINRDTGPWGTGPTAKY